MVTKGKVDNAAQAARQLTDITNKDFSVRSARRVLKGAGLKARFKKKTRLLARHIVTVALPLARNTDTGPQRNGGGSSFLMRLRSISYDLVNVK
jgi:hypothetical protein